jgi:hypothetical protein
MSDTLTTRANLVYWTSGSLEIATVSDRFADLLPDHLRVFDPSYPDTLTAHASLVYWTDRAESDG